MITLPPTAGCAVHLSQPMLPRGCAETQFAPVLEGNARRACHEQVAPTLSANIQPGHCRSPARLPSPRAFRGRSKTCRLRPAREVGCIHVLTCLLFSGMRGSNDGYT